MPPTTDFYDWMGNAQTKGGDGNNGPRLSSKPARSSRPSNQGTKNVDCRYDGSAVSGGESAIILDPGTDTSRPVAAQIGAVAGRGHGTANGVGFSARSNQGATNITDDSL
jgi:hypothetical protein